MAKLLYGTTFGSDDPLRARFPFFLTFGVVEAGYEARIALFGEATNLMKHCIAEQIHGVEWPALRKGTNLHADFTGP